MALHLVTLSQTRYVAGLVNIEIKVIAARLVPQSFAMPGILTLKLSLTRRPSDYNDLRHVMP
jgi:hypothetical protein